MSKTERRFNWRHQYDERRDELEGFNAATLNAEESLTQQHHAEAADINVLARRFGLDKGPIPTTATDPRYYGDLSEVPDLRTALDLVNDAKNRFMELPPRIRSRFRNSPAELWAFINDPENADEAVRLGLLKAPEAEKTVQDPERQKGPADPAQKAPLDVRPTGT